ncbi:NACHT domain-containing NTPase [Marinilabilia salmonicolor]|uniref:NACHT domain-containing protein n=1 Tax=Marinilabilia salmonicolor TaxID=989 RepID=A0A368UKP6_9BACT|nr:hypothetical protein [Marinilabilia salmonicolor]RCW23447.1 hypothetical protein DFO77_1482 [Marinilabilia salmonicolor]
MNKIKENIEWGITQYLRLRPKKTFIGITFLVLVFYISQATRGNIYGIILDELKKEDLNTIVNFVLKVASKYFASPIDTVWFIVIGVIYLIVAVIEYNKSIYVSYTDKRIAETSIKTIINALKRQVENQVQKQVNSHKYIPETFIETYNLKEHFRYYLAPIFFSKKFGETIKRADYSYLNILLKRADEKRYNIKKRYIKYRLRRINTENYISRYKQIENSLKQSQEDLSTRKISSNSKWKAEYKFKNLIEEISHIKSKIALITESAGQGKTNFVCDLAHGFLLKHEIPTVFLLGNQINAQNIETSILDILSPNISGIPFSVIINKIEEYCTKNNKCFIIIIDGLNENSSPTAFSESIETFIERYNAKSFIKFLITCRTEYFQHNFKNITEASFKSDLLHIDKLKGRFNEDLNKKLLDRYLKHFKIKNSKISKEAKKQLFESFLLLRIFCEAYEGVENLIIQDIQKAEIFQMYFEVKRAEITRKLKGENLLNIEGIADINNFIEKLVKYMIEHEKFINIPLNEFAGVESREMLIRYIDENILVRRDLESVEKGIFLDSEVLNFTYDEFRDYCISDYLINTLFSDNQESFIRFIENNLNKESLILEGCSSFLFLRGKLKNNADLNAILANQHWYNQSFVKNIFYLNDSCVNDKDLELLKELIISNKQYATEIVLDIIIQRYDTGNYQMLNIEFLIDYLFELDEEQFEKYIYPSFDNSYNSFPIKEFVEQLVDVLKRDWGKDSPYHNLFAFLVFLIPLNYRVADLLKDYNKKYPDKHIAHLKRFATMKNDSLSQKVLDYANTL